MDHAIFVNEFKCQTDLAEKLVASLNRQGPLLHFRRQGGSTEFRLNVESIVLHPRLMVPDNVKGGRVGLIGKGRECVNLTKPLTKEEGTVRIKYNKQANNNNNPCVPL